MKRLFLSLSLLVSLPLWAVDYPVVYVRAPRVASVKPKMPEVMFATVADPGADLVRLDGGAQTVLYDCDATCSVTDPSVSLDGTRIYFSLIDNPGTLFRSRVPLNGCSLYGIAADGSTPVEPLLLASAGYTEGLPAGYAPPVKPCHLGPQELPSGRLAFTSTLWGTGGTKALQHAEHAAVRPTA